MLKEEIKIYSTSNKLAQQQAPTITTSLRDIPNKTLQPAMNTMNNRSKSPLNINTNTKLTTSNIRQPTLSPSRLKSTQLKLN
jgi:hypothetical protein